MTDQKRFVAIVGLLLAAMSASPLPAQRNIGAPSGGRVVGIRSPFDAQDVPDLEVLRRVEAIRRDRPREAEAAARAFVYHIAPERVGTGDGPAGVPLLDQLKERSVDAYWQEVAHLVMQFEMLQNVMLRDSVRGRHMAILFGTEFEARSLQRAWRPATEADRQRMRSQLEGLMSRHVQAEDELRAMEIRDVERRLNEIRAESDRRRQRRAELVQWAVDDIILQAQRPEE